MNRNRCLLCDRELEPSSRLDRQIHPETEDCLVRVTNAWGINVDEDPPEEPSDESPIVDDDDEPSLVKQFTFVDEASALIFHAHGMQRLGGASSGRGWSSFSMFQTCPYKWWLRYVAPRRRVEGTWMVTENPYLAIGSIMHSLLAIYYGLQNPALINHSDLTPEVFKDELLHHGCNPDYVAEGWRLFVAYRLYYKFEIIEPLALELDLKDPRTLESCRFDLLAYFPEDAPGRLAGTYVVEHKTKTKFTDGALNAWPNDGEVLGQIMLWKRLGLDKRYGELRGVIVNIIGRQKEPKFHRTIVSPNAWQIKQHERDLARWEGLMQLALKYNEFPRARASCATYGLCEYFDHCASGE